MKPAIKLTLTCWLCMTCVPAGMASDVGNWDPPAVSVSPDHREAASKPARLRDFIHAGKLLFATKFNVRDGAGRPAATGDSKPTPRAPDDGVLFTRLSGPDAMSCHACHNQPGIGGSGDFVANVFVGAHFADVPRQSMTADITNERNTTSIAGAGLIELLAREMSAELRARKQAAIERASARNEPVRVPLVAKGVSFGHLTVRPDTSVDVSELQGVDLDLVVRPFGVKGITSSLREFTIAALNHHHGIQATERFGWERTGRDDFDEDGTKDEFTIGQVSAMVLFQASLPPPQQRYSRDPVERAREQNGRAIFGRIGCDVCHIPALPLDSVQFAEPGPYNRPGTLAAKDAPAIIHVPLGTAKGTRTEVNAYTDLKRHNLCDREVAHFCNERRKQDNVDVNLFLTAKIWDLASSAPYGHRGDLSTVSEAIVAHGGEARAARERFLALPDADKRALIAFLLTLGREDPQGGSVDAGTGRPPSRSARLQTR